MRGYTSSTRLAHLRDELQGRDRALIRQVAELRLMTGRQIADIYFPIEQLSADSTSRQARRTLERLTTERLLTRLRRRVGGARQGSDSYVYAIGPVGERLLNLEGRKRHEYREPSERFVAHALAVTQQVVDITVAARRGGLDLIQLQGEPICWRRIPNQPGSLKPDLFVAVGVNDLEYRWFIEVDLGTEHLPTLLRKCQLYERYYRAGIEIEQHGVSPRTLWLMDDHIRAKRLREAIDLDKDLTDQLFVVATMPDSVEAITGGRG